MTDEPPSLSPSSLSNERLDLIEGIIAHALNTTMLDTFAQTFLGFSRKGIHGMRARISYECIYIFLHDDVII